jgi:hypothetical protein
MVLSYLWLPLPNQFLTGAGFWSERIPRIRRHGPSTTRNNACLSAPWTLGGLNVNFVFVLRVLGFTLYAIKLKKGLVLGKRRRGDNDSSEDSKKSAHEFLRHVNLCSMSWLWVFDPARRIRTVRKLFLNLPAG